MLDSCGRAQGKRSHELFEIGCTAPPAEDARGAITYVVYENDQQPLGISMLAVTACDLFLMTITEFSERRFRKGTLGFFPQPLRGKTPRWLAFKSR
jgi:hypothetical protein